LHIPLPRGRQVSRLQLVAEINTSLDRKLTLVSAPAGFGKTTLVSEWSRQADRAVTWFSIDRGDNDVVRFLSYLIAALQHIESGFGYEGLEMLDGTHSPSVQKLLVSLINEFDEQLPPSVLVLDDYHLVDNREVHEAVEYLLENLPDNLHLIIATRADPPWSIARLRVSNQMTEIRVEDLRFDSSQVDEFLNQVMGLGLSTVQVTDLDRRTEGWAAGLQMAALSMRGKVDVDEFIRSFAGSHRFILDYLIEEVLSQQTRQVQEFLLRTSILERLSAPLCDAVRSQDDSQEILVELDLTNLFIFSMDSERSWYRYHHLFAELLQSRLGSQLGSEIPLLHRRASDWFAGAGLIDEAIRHAKLAEDPERIAALVEDNAMQMFFQSRIGALSKWMEMLPDELIRSRPWLCIYHAWTLYWIGRRDRVEDCLTHAERCLQSGSLEKDCVGWANLRQEQKKHISGYIAALRAYNTLRDMPYAVAMAQRAIELLPEGDHMLATTEITMGGAYWAEGNVEKSEQAFARARGLALDSGFQAIAVSATCYQGTQQVKQAHLKEALATFQRAAELAKLPDGRTLLASGLAEIKIGKLYLEWNRLSEAAGYLENGVRRLDRLANIDFLVEGLTWSAELALAMGATGLASDHLHNALRLAGVSEIDPWVDTWLNHCYLKYLIQSDRLSEAAGWVREAGIDYHGEIDYLYDLHHLLLARVLLVQGMKDPSAGDLAEARRLLERLLFAAENAGWVNERIAIQVMYALAACWMEDEAQALSDLAEALDLAEQDGFIRTFIDWGGWIRPLLERCVENGVRPSYAGKLIAEMDRDIPVPSQPDAGRSPVPLQDPPRLVEPLSARELDVLRLLRTELSVPEIADELIIAPSTVRTHIKNIYSKLDAHSRLEALRKAADLDII
jgi:LuxR family maltose regulon positive regulatory protein